MICVSIGRSRHKHMMAEHAHLVEQGAELVELRLDYISSRVNIQRLLKDRPCATVITVRREQDGGKYTGSEEARLIMLREAIADGVEYVDLEDDIAGKIPRFGKTKRIISYHNFRNTPDNLRELHARMKALDADIVKIATMANQPHDNLRMLEMMQESDCPTIGMCMGDIGTPSRILAAEVRGAVHLRHVPSRAGARAGAAQLRADGEHLPAQQHRAGDGRVRRDRRSGRPQPEPADSQRGVRRSGHRRGVRAVPRAVRRAGAVRGGRAAAGHSRA